MVAIQFDHLEGEGHFGTRAIQFGGARAGECVAAGHRAFRESINGPAA
jgi:hypothetical protein